MRTTKTVKPICEHDNQDATTGLCPSCLNQYARKVLVNARRNRARQGRDDAMRSLGLVKVKGSLGGTYWE